jgi:glycosyltransferase involved in cell wall biosynthesis
MIVKNEENTLPQCLQSVSAVCDEIILVDTGSTDATVAVAKSFNARVIEDPWRNDFSYSRNISIQNANHPWVLWLDADDIMPVDSLKKIQEIKKTFTPDQSFGFLVKNSMNGKTGETFKHIRLFPNHPKIRFEYKVHEQVLPSIQRLNMKVTYTDIVILHTGYHTPEAMRQKQERNMLILEKEIEETKTKHPVRLYLYAGALADLQRPLEAIPVYEKAFYEAREQNSEKHIFEIVPLILCNIGFSLQNFNLIERWLSVAKSNTPDHILLHFLNGKLHESRKEFENARDAYEKVLRTAETPSYIPVDYKGLKLQACSELGKLYGTVFFNKKRMMDILEIAKQL